MVTGNRNRNGKKKGRYYRIFRITLEARSDDVFSRIVNAAHKMSVIVELLPRVDS